MSCVSYLYVQLQFLSDLSKLKVPKGHFYSFNAVDLALSQLGFTEQKKFVVYELLASILHLGNIDLEEDCNNICRLKDSSKISFESSAKLLQVDAKILEQALFHRHLGGKDNIRFVFNFTNCKGLHSHQLANTLNEMYFNFDNRIN